MLLALLLLLNACGEPVPEKQSDLGTQVTEIEDSAQTAPVILPSNEN